MDKNKVLNAETQEQARQYAIEWQAWQSEQSMSWDEVKEWNDVFEYLAVKFYLYDEFAENGII